MDRHIHLVSLFFHVYTCVMWLCEFTCVWAHVCMKMDVHVCTPVWRSWVDVGNIPL